MTLQRKPSPSPFRRTHLEHTEETPERLPPPSDLRQKHIVSRVLDRKVVLARDLHVRIALRITHLASVLAQENCDTVADRQAAAHSAPARVEL